MILSQGVYFPDGEVHMVEWCRTNGEIVDGRTSYQIKKLRAALGYCKSFRTAVDVGAHIGMWSMQLAKKFARVEAFEPVEAHRACFSANLRGMFAKFDETESESEVGSAGKVGNCFIDLHACALGDHEDMIRITTEPTSSGDSRVDGKGDVPMHTLDSFALQDVDFIKIDTEGFELFVIKGAEETIKRCRPVMVVEQKGHGMKYFGFRQEEGVELLKSWGMVPLREPMSGDWIMGWPE